MPLRENFRTARWIRTANLVLQAILILTLFAGLNYLANNRAGGGLWRFDLTRNHRFTLSPETIAYVRDLPGAVKITVTVGEDDAPADLRGILREYVNVSESNPPGRRIAVEYIDVDLARHKAQQLGVEEPNRIVVQRGNFPTVLKIDELYSYENQERRAFLGEQRITSAILSVTDATRKKIYFLFNHSELRPDDPDPVRGLSRLHELLRQQNFDVESSLLDLSRTPRIPPDASLIVAVWPKTPFSALEQELLRKYLVTGDGRLMLFLAPDCEHGLDQLLHDWGITVDNDFLRDTGLEMTEDGDFILSAFDAKHPVTQALLHSSYKARLRVGSARTVRPEPARAAGNGLDVQTLVASSPTAWGEVSDLSRGRPPLDPRVDILPQSSMTPPNRLGIAVAAERVAARDNLPFSVPTGRLLVVGSGDLLDNRRIEYEGVVSFFSGAVNWMTDKDAQLTKVQARPVERFQILLSPRELQNLRYSLIFGLPGLAALLGLIVYWTRRT